MSEDKEIERIKRMFNNNTYGPILGQDIEYLLSKISKLEKVKEAAKDLRYWMDRVESGILQQDRLDVLVFDKALKELEDERVL